MLVVGRSDIEAAVDLSAMAVEIEAAYVAASAGEVELPPVGHITFPEVDGDCHIKFGHRRGEPYFVIKVATGFPRQAAAGAATGNGLSLVMSATTGAVEAVMHDEMLLTDVRTGIGGAIATRLLARPDARRVLVVGTGVQARHQIEAHVALCAGPLDIHVWGRSPGRSAQVVDSVAHCASVAVAPDLEAACRSANVIVTTTAATEPIIRAEWIQPGTHITAVGADAPGKHELDPNLLRRADLLAVDSRTQCLDHGELSAIADDSARPPIAEIGELLNPRSGRRSEHDITIADLTGIAAQDIAAATFILDALST